MFIIKINSDWGKFYATTLDPERGLQGDPSPRNATRFGTREDAEKLIAERNTLLETWRARDKVTEGPLVTGLVYDHMTHPTFLEVMEVPADA